MSTAAELQQTIDEMVDATRGILAADESAGTIKKRFDAIGVESTEENRRAYRALLLDTPELGQYICGVILFEETLGQRNDAGLLLPQLAAQARVLPGIKVDKGKGPLAGAPGDEITYGLDGLPERLASYKQQGARFAKWRAVYTISDRNPTPLGLAANAEMLARYAAECQALGLVPIVEPEVLMDGGHDLDRCFEVTEAVLRSVFEALALHRVSLEQMLLKPSMVLPGKDCRRAAPEAVARATLGCLKRTVPAAVPSINFLSGGQGPEEATANLNALNQLKGNAPWQLSSSFGRALQQPVLHAWAGQAAHGEAAQRALLKRTRLNSLARQGQYRPDMESD